MKKILADFNSMTSDGRRIFIGNNRSQELSPGDRVLIHEPDDFEVEADIELDVDENDREWWYAVPDWSTRRDLPPSNKN